MASSDYNALGTSRATVFKELYSKFPRELVNLIFNFGGDLTTADNILAVVGQSHRGMYLCECDNSECLLEQHLDDEQYIRLSFAHRADVHISRVVHPDCLCPTPRHQSYVRAPRSHP